MSSAPPIEFSVDRFAVWRIGIVALVGLAWAALFAWWWTMPAPTPVWATALALAGGAGVLVCGIGLLRTPRSRLRWDGRAWSVDTGAGQAQTGELGVAVDLGSWLLLRFVASPPRLPWPPAVRWIPVQRAGLEPRWHALRCTIYAPRPPATEPG